MIDGQKGYPARFSGTWSWAGRAAGEAVAEKTCVWNYLQVDRG